MRCYDFLNLSAKLVAKLCRNAFMIQGFSMPAFFLGILVAMAALDSTHLQSNLATYMDSMIGNISIIVISNRVAFGHY